MAQDGELEKDEPPIRNEDAGKPDTEIEETTEKQDEGTDEDLNRKRKHQDDAGLIAEHYNKIQAVKPEARGQSRIINLRNFNNWLKGVLITEFCGRARATTVLDLACGKGGDLPKWKRTPIKKLVGIDIASLSIEEAKSRYELMAPKFDASYHVLDAFHKDWSEVIPEGQTFDVISCQFAYHYSFETEESAKHSLAMVGKYLKSGGYFFGTIPNFRAIRELLAGGQSMHNDICSLRLDEGFHWKNRVLGDGTILILQRLLIAARSTSFRCLFLRTWPKNRACASTCPCRSRNFSKSMSQYQHIVNP